MPKNPPEDTPRITPYIFYEDVNAALDFLTDAFGFGERMRIPGPDGKPVHAEMELGDDGVIMLGHPGPEFQNPKRHGHINQLIYVYVDDVDEHFKQAKAAGATIVAEPEDQFYGDRRYAARDLEGHEWNFATHVRDVAPDELQPPG
jgi:PhnB protein